ARRQPRSQKVACESASAKPFAIGLRRSSSCRRILIKPLPGRDLPKAEAALSSLAAAMREGIAPDAKLVGIYSGGAWLAERLGELLSGDHAVGYIDVSFYRDDY